MADFLKKFKNLVLGKKESKEIVSNLSQFNETASAYLDVLEKKVAQKEKKVHKIRVLVQKFLPKQKLPDHTSINIKLIDIFDTKITNKSGTSHTKMDWEKRGDEFSDRRRGTII